MNRTPSHTIEEIVSKLSPEHRDGAKLALDGAWDQGLGIIIKSNTETGFPQYHAEWVTFRERGVSLGSVRVVSECSRGMLEEIVAAGSLAEAAKATR